MRKPLGLLLWTGRSEIDGRPIAVILTGLQSKSRNKKTGPMLQTWIIRARVHPVTAIRTGGDVSICGDCPLRGLGCYVEAGQAPAAVYRALRAGRYERYEPAEHNQHLRGQRIRMGSYGDPAAAPYRVWANLARVCDDHTGYTHQHANPKFWRFRQLLMASVDSPAGAAEAQSRGWRTFRVDARPGGSTEILENEVNCPASNESGNRLDCYHCGACSGNRRPIGAPMAVSICIDVHGRPGTVSQFRQAVTS